jgi:hypothetical protein
MAGRNPRVRNGHRRRQVRAQVLAEEDVCALCGQLVDKTLPAGLPGSPEVDEVTPVSAGGSPFDRGNCQLSHRLCNQRAGAKRRPRPVIRNWTTERTWTP